MAPVVILSGAGGFFKEKRMSDEMQELETISFKVSPEFSAMLAKCVLSLDVSRSKAIRAALQSGLPFIVQNPDLIDSLSQKTCNMKGYKEDTGNGR